MSRKGAVNLTFDRAEAEVASRIIGERIGDADLKSTPFPQLRVFAIKLAAAVKRRRSNSLLKLWTVTRTEAESGYRYLMLFSHPDAPDDELSNPEMDAVHNIAIAIAWTLSSVRGARSLTREEIEARIQAWDKPESSEPEPKERTWVDRLKVRRKRETAFWSDAYRLRRDPIPASIVQLLRRPGNTANQASRS